MCERRGWTPVQAAGTTQHGAPGAAGTVCREGREARGVCVSLSQGHRAELGLVSPPELPQAPHAALGATLGGSSCPSETSDIGVAEKQGKNIC